MPPVIIDCLEQVDIDHHHRQRVPEPLRTPAFVHAQLHQGAAVGEPRQRVIGRQQRQCGIELLQQGVLFGQLAVDLLDFAFPALAVVDIERHPDQTLARRAALAVHDAAIVGVPDPFATLRAQPELAAVLRHATRQMVIHGFFHLTQIVRMEKPVDTLQVGSDFLLAEAQFHKRLAGLESHLVGDQIVLPQIQPGSFQRQLQPILVEICVTHGERPTGNMAPAQTMPRTVAPRRRPP